MWARCCCDNDEPLLISPTELPAATPVVQGVIFCTDVGLAHIEQGDFAKRSPPGAEARPGPRLALRLQTGAEGKRFGVGLKEIAAQLKNFGGKSRLVLVTEMAQALLAQGKLHQTLHSGGMVAL